MKISGPLKLFRSVIRYLGCKKALSTFEIRIFEFLTLDFGPQNSIAPKQKKNKTSKKTILEKGCQNGHELGYLSWTSLNQSIVACIFPPSSIIRYLAPIYRIRETSHYSIRSRIRWNSHSPWKSNKRASTVYKKFTMSKSVHEMLKWIKKCIYYTAQHILTFFHIPIISIDGF